MRLAPLPGLAAILMLLGASPVSTAQDWLGILKEQAKQRASRAAEQAIDKGLDAAEAQVTTAEQPAEASTTGGNTAPDDRFTSIIAAAPESTVVNGYVVNNRRVAVQKELTARPPTPQELGVVLPAGARLDHERTARQIAQYHPNWRIYKYEIEMPRAELVRFFTDQGLTYDRSWNKLFFSRPTGNGEDFIDSLEGDPVEGFRIWRRPPGSSGTGGRP